jgi:hypothetical protein
MPEHSGDGNWRPSGTASTKLSSKDPLENKTGVQLPRFRGQREPEGGIPGAGSLKGTPPHARKRGGDMRSISSTMRPTYISTLFHQAARRSVFCGLVLLLSSLLASTNTAWGQATTSLRGTITDPSGAQYLRRGRRRTVSQGPRVFLRPTTKERESGNSNARSA